MYALASKQGTACDETALCAECYAFLEHKMAIEEDASHSIYKDPPVLGTWTDCTDNEALVCTVCGKPEQKR